MAAALDPKNAENLVKELPASAILGPRQKAMLANFLNKDEMAALDGCTMEQLVDILSRYPGLLETVVRSATGAVAPDTTARPTVTSSNASVNPYGGLSFTAYRENYVKNNQDEIKKRHRSIQRLKDDIKAIAQAVPPELDENTMDPEVDSFLLVHFLTKLWRLINVIATMFPEDPEPAVLLNILEGTILPQRDSWDFVAREYYDVMSVIFDDIDEAIRLHEEDRKVDYGFLVKVANHPLFKQLDVHGKIMSPRLKPSNRRNLLITLQHMNAFTVLNKHLDPCFFLAVQKFGCRLTVENKLDDLNESMAPGRLYEASQYGKALMSQVNASSLFAVLKDKVLWKRVGKSLRLVSNMSQLSNLKYVVAAVDQMIEEAPEGYYI